MITEEIKIALLERAVIALERIASKLEEIPSTTTEDISMPKFLQEAIRKSERDCSRGGQNFVI